MSAQTRNKGIITGTTLLFITCLLPGFSGGEDVDSLTNSFLQDRCRIDPHHPGTFQVLCSCKPNETLTLSEAETKKLASSVIGFHVSDCNRSTVVVKTNALNHFNYLELVTFHNIATLRLEPNSINLALFHVEDFALTFEDILGSGLSLEENSVRLQRPVGSAANEKLVFSNAVIRGFPKFAINGPFTELQLRKVLLTERAQSESINVGETETEVIINTFEALNGGLEAKWLLGNVNNLQIIRSSILMKQYAFAGITMTGSAPEMEMSHNQFGSLPTGVFDINATFAEVSVKAENNRINCACEDLIWIRENLEGFLQNRLNFICDNITLTEALRKCSPIDASSSSDNTRLSHTAIITLFLAFTYSILL
ncbi:uncharacterized protein LOC135215702 [Macrobrachium nipponense]|uniref:uncharacterized protein LOC135215702 n=1 Tax=Macrobrachium nipponense TaxID=159736 RepID=UPI0030C8BFE4